jgi:F-type H+-transporting ATPase subunit delta
MRPSRKKIAAVIDSRIRNGESINKIAKEMAAYLLDNNRSSELESIMRDVIALRAEQGQVEVSVSTAHKLEAGTKEDLKKLIKTIRPAAKDIQIDEDIDPSLIGGLKLGVVNQSLDLSIRAKLNKLKQLTTAGGV